MADQPENQSNMSETEAKRTAVDTGIVPNGAVVSRVEEAGEKSAPATIEPDGEAPTPAAAVGVNGDGPPEPVAVEEAPESSVEPTVDGGIVAPDASLTADDIGEADEPGVAEADGTPEFQELALITRFIIGLALVGGDELLRRLQDYQADIEAIEALGAAEYILDEETQLARFRYFVVGSVMRNQRRLLRAVNQGLNTTGSLAGRVNRATDNWLFQPVRRPVTSLAMRFAREVELAIVEGRDEDRSGRILARQTVLEFVDEFVDYLSESPELADLVRDQIGEQSVGLAGTVVENTREVSASADNVVEGLVRKLFRLPQRKDLPRSPFIGDPDTLYSPNQGLSAQEERDSDEE